MEAERYIEILKSENEDLRRRVKQYEAERDRNLADVAKARDLAYTWRNFNRSAQEFGVVNETQ